MFSKLAQQKNLFDRCLHICFYRESKKRNYPNMGNAFCCSSVHLYAHGFTIEGASNTILKDVREKYDSTAYVRTSTISGRQFLRYFHDSRESELKFHTRDKSGIVRVDVKIFI